MTFAIVLALRGWLLTRALERKSDDGLSAVILGIQIGEASRGGTVLEDAKYFPRWNQTLALLWFEDEDGPSADADNEEGDDAEPLLRPLDGVLPWPGRRRR